MFVIVDNNIRASILVNNFVLSKFLGICPFLGVSKRLDTALGMSGAVIFVMAIASFFTSLVFRYLFSGPVSIGPFKDMNLGFLQILLFIVIIAALVQIVELMMQKLSPALYKSLGIYLPLITTNCAVLGAVTINANEARELALSRDKVKEHLKGASPAKVIYVPGKLINVVVK